MIGAWKTKNPVNRWKIYVFKNKMVRVVGIEPTLLSEPDFERPKGRYSKHRRLQVKARKPTTINDLA